MTATTLPPLITGARALPGMCDPAVASRPELDWAADSEAVVLPVNDQGGVHLVDPGYEQIPGADPRGWTVAPGAHCACLPSVSRRKERDGTTVRVVTHHAFDGRESGSPE